MDAASVTFVVVVAALFVVLWRKNRALDGRIRTLADVLANVEGAVRSAGYGELLGPRHDKVQIQKASFEDGRWRVNARLFRRDGVKCGVVVVDDLRDETIRRALASEG